MNILFCLTVEMMNRNVFLQENPIKAQKATALGNLSTINPHSTLRSDRRPVQRCAARGSHSLEGRKITRAYSLLLYSLSSDGAVLRDTFPSPSASPTGAVTKRHPRPATSGIPLETPLCRGARGTGHERPGFPAAVWRWGWAQGPWASRG